LGGACQAPPSLIDLESIFNYPIPNRHHWATSRPAARPSTVSNITLVNKECM
jgi:hypothetical protein